MLFNVQHFYGFGAINQLPVAPAEYQLPADMGSVLAS